MQWIEKVKMSDEEIGSFLNKMDTGRLATISEEGYPVIIPLNFVYLNHCIYFHTAPVGEKLIHIQRNPKVGFEVDQHILTVPSYYSFGSTDPAKGSTLYKSVVIVGQARMLENDSDKILPLQKLMEKYQPEGGYDPVALDNKAIKHTTVIEIAIEKITGKKKIGQHWPEEKRLYVAKQIMKDYPDYQRILSEIEIEMIDNGNEVTLAIKK